MHVCVGEGVPEANLKIWNRTIQLPGKRRNRLTCLGSWRDGSFALFGRAEPHTHTHSQDYPTMENYEYNSDLDFQGRRRWWRPYIPGSAGAPPLLKTWNFAFQTLSERTFPSIANRDIRSGPSFASAALMADLGNLSAPSRERFGHKDKNEAKFSMSIKGHPEKESDRSDTRGNAVSSPYSCSSKQSAWSLGLLKRSKWTSFANPAKSSNNNVVKAEKFEIVNVSSADWNLGMVNILISPQLRISRDLRFGQLFAIDVMGPSSIIRAEQTIRSRVILGGYVDIPLFSYSIFHKFVVSISVKEQQKN